MMYLVITVDTEEDNWGEYDLPHFTTSNIEKINALQALFDKYEVKPTYLITYPVATDEKAVAMLKEIMDDGRCEIGTHPHPWNTPPIEEKRTARNSMMCNLPGDLQYKKIKTLHETIRDNFNVEPVSFRSGRWAFDQNVARNIYKLGYKVDTSVTPYTNWESIYGPDFSTIAPRPYKFSLENIFEASQNGELIEIPATVGFLQNNFVYCNNVQRVSDKFPFRIVKLSSILKKLNLINKVWLSPESSDGKTMITLAKLMMEKGYTLFNMPFHSTSMKAGMTPFVKINKDEDEIIKRIEDFLSFAKHSGMKSITMSDCCQIFN